MRLRLAAPVLALALVASAPAPRAWAQQPDELTQRSLPLRTALHHDPTLESALERLLALYREADRVEELVGVYRSHLSSYPRDLSARTVFVRLLLLSGDREAENELRRALALFPKQGYLAYLRYQLLEQDNDPRALELLDKAISLERRPVRRRAWVQRLLERAVSQDRRDLARKHLKNYAKLMGSTAGAHLAAARKMLAYDFELETLEELELAAKKRPNPETGVEIELLAAKALVALDRRDDAAKRLDELLGRLTADYWRRPEILRRRARLISSAKERQELVKQARADWEREETPAKALDLARLLSGFDRRREALDVIVAASRKLPQVRRLEQEALALFDRLRDERGRIAYLEERLEREPERLDLAEQRMRSLFQLGRNAAAQQALDAVIAKLSPRDQVKRLAETARFLRAQAFPSFAAQVFRKAVEAAPRRLDLRRELAETLLATGERGAAHAALRRPLPAKVDTALFLDLVQLMLREQLLRPARAALLQQLQARPEHFELLLSLLEVEGRLGNGRRGRELAEKTRQLADNQARYRRWLESALGFYEFFFREQLFFKGELDRFAKTEEWSKRSQERLLAFADLCAAQQRAEELSKLIAQLLERKDLPKSLELELRRRLVAVPTFEADEVKRTVANLEQLAKEDPARKTEYNARLALAHAAGQRLDKARTLLAQVDASNLRDPDLLRGLAGLARHLRDGERALALLERVTEVDAGDREAWERYVYALATTGDEARLRGALHQILRAGPKLPLEPGVRRLLRAHLSDSAWRSVSVHLAAREEDDALEALALLDQVERTSDEGRTWVWVAWARAYAHNLLGRAKERDAALGELERALDNLERTQKEAAEQAERERARKLAEAKRRAQASGGPPPPKPAKEEPLPTALPGRALVLPDGLCASPQAARDSLTKDYGAAPPPLADRQGPLAPLELQWAFDTYGEAPVVSVQPLGATRLLVSDEGGNVYGVSRATGKLEWVLPGALSASGARQHRETRTSGGSTWTTHHNEYWRAALPVVAQGGDFYLPRPGSVELYDLEGKRKLELQLASVKELGQAVAPPLSVIVDGGRTYLWEPCTGQAAALDQESSKLLWLTTLPKPRSGPKRVGPGVCGASYADGRLLVYGRWTAILSAETGVVRWSAEVERVREAAVQLTGGGEDPLAVLLPGLGGPGGGGLTRGAPLFRPGGPGQASGPNLVDHTARRSSWRGSTQDTRLVSPVVVWANNRESSAVRRAWVQGSKLVLAGSGGAQGLQLIDLELPMFGRRVQLQGTHIGSYGSLFVLLTGSTLEVVDLERGAAHATLSLSDLTQSGKAPLVSGAMDGPLAYLSGPKGVLCLNVATKTRLFFQPWPDLVAPQAEWPKSGGVSSYGYQGITVEAKPNPVARRSLEPVGLADRGELFVVSDASRLVCFRAGQPGEEPRER